MTDDVIGAGATNEPVVPGEFIQDDNLGLALPEPTPDRPRTVFNPEGSALPRGLGFADTYAGALRQQTLAGRFIQSGEIETVRGGPSPARQGYTSGSLGLIPQRVRDQIEAREVSLPEREKAKEDKREEALRAIDRQVAYENSDAYVTPATVAGTLAAAVSSPEALLGFGRLVARAFPALAGHTLGPTVGRTAVDAAISNTVTDPAVQGVGIASGGQGEYDISQTLMAPVVGAAAGAPLGAAARVPGKIAEAIPPSARLTPADRAASSVDALRAFDPANAQRTVQDVVTQPEPPRTAAAADTPPVRLAPTPGEETLDMPPAKATAVPEIRDNPPYYPEAESASPASPPSDAFARPQIGDATPSASMPARPELGEATVTAKLNADQIKADTGAEIDGTLIRQLRGGLPTEPDGITGWHGSPHDFERFSSEKIGTGEGNQTYGHGLYFGEQRATAENYQKQLAGKDLPLREIVEKELGPVSQNDLAVIYSATTNNDRDPLKAARSVQMRLPHLRDEGASMVGPPSPIQEKIAKVIEAIRERNRGALYEVRIAAKPEHFLDWDKPLSQQSPEVQAVLKRLGIEEPTDPLALGTRTGAEAYTELGYTRTRSYIEPAEASRVLRENGIAGIRYLDAQSRRPGFTSLTPAQLDARIEVLRADIASGGGDQARMKEKLAALERDRDSYRNLTYNYVVFDDNNIHIVAKNGKNLAQPMPVVDFLKGEATGKFVDPMRGDAVAAARQAAQIVRDAPAGSLPAFRSEAVQAPPVPNAPAGIFMFDAPSLKVDAKRFQFKENGDTEGVTARLKGVSRWDQAKGNQIIVWQDKAGDLYVVDGHQRTGLARRLIAEGKEAKIELPGLLYREADGITAEDVRAIAAAKNLGEGSGSALDGAKVLRTRPDLLDGSLPLTEGKTRQAVNLARLEDEPFRMVVNEVVPENYGAVVGEVIPKDGALQEAAIKAIARFEPRNVEEATALVQRVKESELARAEEGKQTSLFGDTMAAESTAGEEMRIVAKVIQDAKRDKTLLGRVVDNASRIEQTGSTIQRDAAQAMAGDSALAAKLMASEAYSAGPVRDALLEAARNVKAGKQTLADAARDVFAAVRREAEGGVRARAGDSPRGEQASSEGIRTETGADGFQQELIPGVSPVTDAQRIAVEAAKPMRGGNADLPGDGLFGDSANQDVLFRRKPQAGASGPPTSPPTSTAGSAGAGGPGASPTPASPATHEVTSLQAQAIKLADDLGITLREGRVQGGKDALGQYDTRQGVARVRAIASFDDVAHEAAHGLETKIGAELKTRIQAAQAELGPLDYDPTRQSSREGFGEFVVLYLTNPAAAQRAAPQFMNEFRAFMAAQHPDILASLDAAQAAHTAYINAPSDVKLDAIVQRTEPETIASRIREDGMAPTVSLMVGRAYEGLLDDKAPVTRAVRDLARMARDANGVRLSLEGSDNPENLVRLFGRAMQAGVHDMMDGVRPYHKTVPEGPSLRDALIKATGEPGIFGRWDDARLKEFSNYLVARRAEVLWRKFEAGDLPNRPAALTKADTLDAIARAEAANPNFRAASDEVHAYTRELLRKQYEGGIINRDLYDKLLQEDFYVPLYRDMRDKPNAGAVGGGQSPDGPGMTDTIKRQRGSDRDIIDPIQGIMTQTFLVNRTLAHNDIVRSLVDLARQAQRAGAVGTGRIIEELTPKELVGKRFDLQEVVRAAAQQHGIDEMDTKVLLGSLSDVFGDDPIMGTIFRREPAGKRGEPLVFYKEGGELRAARLISKDEGVGLYEALAQLPPQLRDWAVQVGSASTSALRMGVVSNPVFAFTNFTRDQIAAAILRPNYIPFDFRGIVSEIRQDKIAQMYSYAGGVSPGAGAAGLSEFIKGDVEALARKGWAVQKVAGIADLVTRGDIKAGAKAISETVGTAESATRLNIMRTVFEQKKKQGLSDYDAMIEGAAQATDILDFGRHGSRTQTIESLVPFLRTHLQGLDKARRTFVEPVLRALRGDMVTEQEVAALKNAGLAWFKMAGVGGALGFAYGMWASKYDAYRDANDNLRATHLVLPGSSFGHDGKVIVTPKPFELAIGFNLGELLGQYVATGDPRTAGFAAEGVREVLFPPNLLNSIPILKTFAELSLNRSFFTGRDIVPPNLQRLTPAEQVRPNTAALAKEIGAAIGVSPIKVEHAVGSMFGLWGRDLLAASNATDGNGPAAALEDQVFFRRFIKSASSSSESLKRFWDLASAQNGKFAQAKNSYENMTGQFRDADASRFLASLASPERAYVTLNSAADETGRLKFTADEKRLHPLTRGAEAVRILNGYVQELQVNAQKDYGTGQQVAMDPQKRRQAIDAIRVLSAMEQRNALTIMRDKGYEDRKVLSTEDQLATIRALDPRVADEIATRYATKKIAPTDAIARAWPEAQRRLLQDGSQADLSDLALDAKADGYAFGADRVKRPQKRRLVIPSSPVNPGQVQPSP